MSTARMREDKRHRKPRRVSSIDSDVVVADVTALKKPRASRAAGSTPSARLPLGTPQNALVTSFTHSQAHPHSLPSEDYEHDAEHAESSFEPRSYQHSLAATEEAIPQRVEATDAMESREQSPPAYHSLSQEKAQASAKKPSSVGNIEELPPERPSSSAAVKSRPNSRKGNKKFKPLDYWSQPEQPAIHPQHDFSRTMNPLDLDFPATQEYQYGQEEQPQLRNNNINNDNSRAPSSTFSTANTSQTFGTTSFRNAPAPTMSLRGGFLDTNPTLMERPVSSTQDITKVFGGKLPGPDSLQGMVGEFNGYIAFVAHPNGDVLAHQWDHNQYQWINIGQYSASRRRVEGSLAGDTLRGQTISNAVPSNTLAYFKGVAKQREAASREADENKLKRNIYGLGDFTSYLQRPKLAYGGGSHFNSLSSAGTVSQDSTNFPTLESFSTTGIAPPRPTNPPVRPAPRSALSGFVEDPFTSSPSGAELGARTQRSCSPSISSRNAPFGKMDFDFRFPQTGTRVPQSDPTSRRMSQDFGHDNQGSYMAPQTGYWGGSNLRASDPLMSSASARMSSLSLNTGEQPTMANMNAASNISSGRDKMREYLQRLSETEGSRATTAAQNAGRGNPPAASSAPKGGNTNTNALFMEARANMFGIASPSVYSGPSGDPSRFGTPTPFKAVPTEGSASTARPRDDDSIRALLNNFGPGMAPPPRVTQEHHERSESVARAYRAHAEAYAKRHSMEQEAIQQMMAQDNTHPRHDYASTFAPTNLFAFEPNNASTFAPSYVQDPVEELTLEQQRENWFWDVERTNNLDRWHQQIMSNAEAEQQRRTSLNLSSPTSVRSGAQRPIGTKPTPSSTAAGKDKSADNGLLSQSDFSRLLLPALQNLLSYKNRDPNAPRDYFARFGPPPVSAIDTSPEGDMSFFSKPVMPKREERPKVHLPTAPRMDAVLKGPAGAPAGVKPIGSERKVSRERERMSSSEWDKLASGGGW